MYCGTCGKQLREGAKFCDECGTIQPAAIPESQKPKAEPVVIQPILPENKPQKPKKERKKVNKKLLALIAAVLVVAVAAAVLIPILFSGKKTIYVCVEEIRYDVRGVATTRIEREYDDAGNLLLEEIDHGPHEEVWNEALDSYVYLMGEYDGTVNSYSQWEYDENQNIVSYLSTNNYGFSVEYEYDEDGRITEFVYQMEQPVSNFSDTSLKIMPVTYECEYDDEGRLLRVFIPEGFNGDDYTVYLYEYDRDGALVTAYTSMKEGTWRYELSYEDGRLCRMENSVCPTPYFQEGDDSTYVLQGAREYEYDRDGKLTAEITLNKDGEAQATLTYDYDADGFLAEASDSMEYTCDEHGNIIKTVDAQGKRTEYRYEERTVTAQQALTFLRRSSESPFYNYSGTLFDIIKHLVPNPIEEQK